MVWFGKVRFGGVEVGFRSWRLEIDATFFFCYICAMPAPSPDQFKSAIPGPSSNICEKIAKLFTTLPSLIYDWVSFEFNEDGSFTSEFKAMICAISCGSGGVGTGGDNPDNPLMPKPTGVSATDGTFSSKVSVTWNSVTAPAGVGAVTQYKIYRSTSDVTDPNSSVLIATVDAPTTTYDDTLVVQGTTYNYWVVATNGTQNSAYGGPDVGNASAPTTSLDAISDLIASQGFSATNDGVITLWWTPPTGATKYDVYRNTVNTFGTATKIIADFTPLTANISVATEKIYNNIEAMVAYHTPPAGNAKYYFWVVAKKDSPPAVSPESNAAQGWVNVTTGEAGALASGTLGNGDTYTVDPGVVRIKMLVYGMGGGGAGGGTVYGGGGGGAAPTCSIEFAVSAGDTIDLVTTPNADNTGNAAAFSNGVDGSDVDIKLNGVSVLTIVGGSGGVYSASGSGAGGAVGSASGTALVTAWPKLGGQAGSGTSGGRGGAGFPQARLGAAHYSGFGAFTSWEGNGVGSNGGGGSYAEVGVPGAADAVGGWGSGAQAVYATFTV